MQSSHKTGFFAKIGQALGTGLLITLPFQAAAATYYVDSVAGKDANTGTSAAAPWQTLTPVNGQTFLSGDKILLKSGSVFLSGLVLNGSGTASKPITVDKYGAGAKPVLQPPPDATGPCIWIHSVNWWTVRNLETRGGISGVDVYNDSLPVMQGITIQNLSIVNSGQNRPDQGAIYVYMNGQRKGDQFKFLNNDIEHSNNGNGIYWNGFTGSDGSAPTWQKYLSTKVLVSGNTIHGTDGNGIQITACDSPVIEHNALYGAGAVGHPGGSFVGMWSAYCRSALFQYNYVDGIVNNIDGQAFDEDTDNYGTVIFQYNISHNNGKGFFTTAGTSLLYPADVLEIRYNISDNDNYQFMSLWPGKGKALIYNNLFVGANGSDLLVMGTPSTSNCFSNNIWLVKYVGSIPFDQPWEQPALSHNLYWPNSNFGKVHYAGWFDFNPNTQLPDATSLSADPQILNLPKSAGHYADFMKMRLAPTSPCLTHGTTVPSTNPPLLDILGHPLKSNGQGKIIGPLGYPDHSEPPARQTKPVRH